MSVRALAGARGDLLLRPSCVARRPPWSHHPTARVVLGQRARVWPEVHIALVEGQHGDTPLACTVGLLQWGATRPEDASDAVDKVLTKH